MADEKQEPMAAKQGEQQPSPVLASAKDDVLAKKPGAKAGKKKEEKKDQQATRGDYVRGVLKIIEKQFPTISKDLKRSELHMDPPTFVARALMVSGIAAAILGISYLMFASTLGIPVEAVVLLAPIIFIAVFSWVMRYPRLKMKQKETELDKDILFAGRDMLISLKSGVPLFNSMAGVTRNYGVASREFSVIVERIQSGVPAEIALQEASDMNTSRPFRQIILQIVTSMRSGSDVALALEIVLHQISQEQIIALKRYGQKLNPITMFYMLFGIILPSLGIAIGIILTSFVNIKVDFTMLIVVWVILALVQYMFFAMMRSSRPNFEV